MVRVALALFLLSQSAALSGATEWVLAYQGKSTNDFVWDKRARRLVNTRIPATLADDVFEALGVPEPIVVRDQRYVVLSSCAPHSCITKALLWIDTKTGVGLGAQFVKWSTPGQPSVLRLGSNAFSSSHIPSAARDALRKWMSALQFQPSSVEFTERNGNIVQLGADLFK
jgi:hypothetical protein